MNRVDVAVLGAGPAGCAAAITLARAGARVSMFESTTTAPARGEMLPPDVSVPLRRLGVWERFTHDGHLRSPGMVIAWGDPVPHHNDFAFNPYGGGWQLDRARFDRSLATSAAGTGVTVHRGVRVTVRRMNRGGWRLDGTADGRTFCTRADFTLDATGRTARITRRLSRRVVGDRLVGIVATLPSSAVADSTDRRMLIESCPDGWWFSAKIDQHRHVAAFMTDADQVGGSGMRPLQLWRARLASAPLTRDRIGTLGTVDPVIRVAPAGTVRFARICGTDWAAIGDAACTVDPLSGRGVERALNGGIAIGHALIRGERRRALARYRADTMAVIADERRQQHQHYRRETRWAESPFWSRRQRTPAPIEEDT